MITQRLISRRQFLQTGSVVAGTAAAISTGLISGGFPAPAFAKTRNPNDKLNLACIGIANRGAAQVDGASNENIIALCDVDENFLKKTGERFPQAEQFRDYRKLYDKLEGKLDGVLVSTPDHNHAPASLAGMKRGLHCYCEKPLAHTITEVRKMTELAKEKKLFTQMGTQIHAEENYRRVVELVKAGAIGPIEEVHVWAGTKWGGCVFPTEFTAQPPANLDWDLWLGPVPTRPFHPIYFERNWRSFWAFGNGTLGDMGCHHIDLPYWALDLKYPISAEATAPTPPDAECPPIDIVAKFEFPKRGNLPPVVLTWYDGDKRPPLLQEKGLPVWGAGTLFVGKEGMLLADYGRHILYPEAKFADYKRPEPSIPKSLGHHEEWIQAIKTGKGPTTCDFSYSGPLAETVLLGTVAYRMGKKLNWNAEEIKATNCPEADKLLKKTYRTGWGME